MRPWVLKPDAIQGGHKVAVVTYNVLADKYIDVFRNHPNADAKFKSICDWAYREKLILQQLTDYNPDICFLQEVEKQFFDSSLSSTLRRNGLEGLYFARAADVRGRPDAKPEGIALFYRSSMFELEKESAIHFNRVDLPPAFDADSYLRNEYATKGEGVLTARLKHRASGRSLLAAVTHLFWNPNYPHIKVMQAWALARVLERAAVDGGETLPVILGGDFNSLPVKFRPDPFDPEIPSNPGFLSSGVYDLLTRGYIDATHTDHPAQRKFPNLTDDVSTGALGKLASASASSLGHEPPLTTRTVSGFAGTLDYIFYSPAKEMQLSAYLQLPYDSSVGPDPNAVPEAIVRCYPSADQPSDHLAVGAQFTLL